MNITINVSYNDESITESFTNYKDAREFIDSLWDEQEKQEALAD